MAIPMSSQPPTTPTLPALFQRGHGLMRAARIVHPAPSVIVAGAVAALALSAGATPSTAALLAVAMLGFQFSIGALNDLADAPADASDDRDKPIAIGLVSRRTALALGLGGAVVGLSISATHGVVVLVLGAAGWTCGVAYDLVLKRKGLGWVCFAVALPLLLAWSWMAAAGQLPPRWPLILAMAGLSGPTLHLANSLADLERDMAGGRRTLATRLGARGSRAWLSLLVAAIFALALLTLDEGGGPPEPSSPALALAGALAAVGVGLAWLPPERARQAGWLLLATGLAVLAVAWLEA